MKRIEIRINVNLEHILETKKQNKKKNTSNKIVSGMEGKVMKKRVKSQLLETETEPEECDCRLDPAAS